MRLYASHHLERIGLYTWARRNLEQIHHCNDNTNADTYFVPTPEFEKMVQQNNILAALRGQKIAKPVYKNVYNKYRNNRRTDQVFMVWS
jgi:hypothetical protein